MPPARAAVGVEELRRAWRAVQDGDFQSRTARPPHARSGRSGTSGGSIGSAGSSGSAPKAGSAGRAAPAWTSLDWAQGQPAVVVLGCSGSVGATTTALAIATAAGAARVVECCPTACSGLVAAATGELGRHRSGWVQGQRDQVLLERTDGLVVTVQDVPAPAEPKRRCDLTVVDVGWDVATVLASRSWVGELLREGGPVVAVTGPSVPGVRRLERVLSLLPTTSRVVVAAVDPHRGGRVLRANGRRACGQWLAGVEHSIGPVARDLIRRGALVEVPHDAALAVHGLTSAPLPDAVLAAGTHLLRLTQPTDFKGNPP